MCHVHECERCVVSLVGPRGVGKSACLTHAVYHARKNGWLVVYIPQGHDQVNGGPFIQPVEGIPGMEVSRAARCVCLICVYVYMWACVCICVSVSQSVSQSVGVSGYLSVCPLHSIPVQFTHLVLPCLVWCDVM